MYFVNAKAQLAPARVALGLATDAPEPQPIAWQKTDPQLENDNLFGGKDWSDLAVLLNSDTQLGRAVRNGQQYFDDEELVAALTGRSREVTLTVVDGIPVFVNAAMIVEIMTGQQSDSAAA